MRYPAIIIDIDGTIADNRHRQHYLERKPRDWAGFFSEMGADRPKQTVMSVVHLLNWQLKWSPIFVTGRSDEFRAQTNNWLIFHWPWAAGFRLEMRAKGDFRDDAIVKREIYETKIKQEADVRLVLDDRPKVVAMWRELGLECWQVEEGPA